MHLQTENMEHYLRHTEVVDHEHPAVAQLALLLREGCHSAVELAQKTFVYVRDEIHHSADLAAQAMTQGALKTLSDDMAAKLPADIAAKPTAFTASAVLLAKEGICFAKSHLLAALLRHNRIPAGFCYQRLRLNESNSPLVFHGLNAVFLEELGRWLRVDARGNKPGINAQFSLEAEQLAFKPLPQQGEEDVAQIYADPAPGILRTYQACTNFGELWKTLPQKLD